MFPPDATDIIARMSVVNWKRVKYEGSYLARVGMRGDNKSHLCVLASVDETLSTAGWNGCNWVAKETWQHRPDLKSSNVTDNPV